MLILVCISVLILMYLHGKLKQKRKKAGIRGWVQTQDLDGKGRQLYLDPKTGITSRPDVVLNDRVIEHKSAVVKDKARRGDILQLLAEMISAKKDIGELRYANKKNFEFRINSQKMRSLRGELANIKGQMERHLWTRIAPKGRPSRNRCANCNYRRECSESLAA